MYFCGVNTEAQSLLHITCFHGAALQANRLSINHLIFFKDDELHKVTGGIAIG